MAVVPDAAELVHPGGLQDGKLDDQTADAVRYEEERPGSPLPFSKGQDVVEQVAGLGVVFGAFDNLSVPEEHDAGRVDELMDALSDPDVGGRGQVAIDGGAQDGFARQLSDGRVLVLGPGGAAEEAVREGVARPGLG